MTYRPRLDEDEMSAVNNWRHSNSTLIIGDLHAPFTHPDYLQFCINIQKKYNCKNIVFIGDILDNHYSSYHETDPDGKSALAELVSAKTEIKRWNKAFPNAKLCYGNHDLIPNRQAFTNGLSASWIRTIDEVLEVTNWDFKEEFIIDDVLYCHGTGRKARNRAKDDMISIVQGHYHSESYIDWIVGEKERHFAMQIGCGIDRNAYAMAYAKHVKKPHLNVGVIFNGTPIIEYML